MEVLHSEKDNCILLKPSLLLFRNSKTHEHDSNPFWFLAVFTHKLFAMFSQVSDIEGNCNRMLVSFASWPEYAYMP